MYVNCVFLFLFLIWLVYNYKKKNKKNLFVVRLWYNGVDKVEYKYFYLIDILELVKLCFYFKLKLCLRII